MTPKETLALIREKEVRAVDFRFMDFPGLWQHFTIPAGTLDEAVFEEGIGFDGSSIRGWQAINESDMLVLPVPETSFIDPFFRDITLTMICNIQDPLTREDYSRDPRNVARKAVNYMKASGIADTATFRPELQFFIFDDVRYEQTQHSGSYYLDSSEGGWNSGRAESGGNLGYKLRSDEQRFPCPPGDTLQNLRSDMMLCMRRCGLPAEAQRHEIGTGGHGQIDLGSAPLVEMADSVLKYKYIVKNMARKQGKAATFMPKPLFLDTGASMHVHTTLWKHGVNLFAGSGYAGLSDQAMHAIGGVLRHAPALCAITNPTTNSYKRLAVGTDAPINLAYSQRNHTAVVRVPGPATSARDRQLELRAPDGLANPYLAFAALLMAMLDGIKNKINPGEPLEREFPPDDRSRPRQTPTALEDALAHLERDHEFLLHGDVFTKDVIGTWIWYKREKEVDALRTRPHPFEFTLYYDS